MPEFQDYFSAQSATYARARPRYPAELFAYLAGLVATHDHAWDVGTGNGQAAHGLTAHFQRITATDASAEQISHAMLHERIEYRVTRAEESGLPAGSVNLVTIATAMHWFDFDAFFAEVRRVAAPGAVIAAWCYGLQSVSPALDLIFDRIANVLTAGHWPSGRRYVDERYETLPFPFQAPGPIPSFTHSQ